MKICTACNASYSDETLSFCPVDGTTLTPQKEVSLDQIPFSYDPGNWSNTEEPASNRTDSFANSEPPTAAAAFSEPPPFAPQNVSPAPRKNTNNNAIFPIVIVAVALISVAGMMAMILSNRSGGSEPQVRVTSGNTMTLANGTRVRAEPMGTPFSSAGGNVAVVTNAAPANRSTAAENVAKPIPRKTDFTGIWQGEFSDEPTVLSITTQNGDAFSGTLSKKGYIIKITGKIDFDKGTVLIKETEVLQKPANLNWNLGTNDGTIASDGKSMSGTGRDKNTLYSWSFTKD